MKNKKIRLMCLSSVFAAMVFVFSAYLLFYLITMFHDIIIEVFFSIQFNCQNRYLFFLHFPEYDKVKTASIKIVLMREIV